MPKPYPELEIMLIKVEIEGHLHDKLSPKLSPEEWEDLIDDHYVDKLLAEELTSSEVADMVRRRRQIYGQRAIQQESAAQNPPQEDQPPNNESVLSLLVAEEVSKEKDVQEFRTDKLDGQFIPLQEVSDWLKARAIEDGPATWWLMDVPLSPDQIGYAAIPIPTSGEVPQYKMEVRISKEKLSDCLIFRFLFYREPETHDKKEIPTAKDGTLEKLRLLSERLANDFAWEQADATLFILTNTVPQIKPFIGTPQIRLLPALSRIHLTIDPALSPQEVAEHYRQKRQELMPTRHRDLSEKHLQLAIFSGTQPRLGTWKQKMQDWNTLYPQWAYKEPSNFAHDCLQSRRRVLRSD